MLAISEWALFPGYGPYLKLFYLWTCWAVEMQEWLQVGELNSRQDLWYFPSCGNFTVSCIVQVKSSSMSTQRDAPIMYLFHATNRRAFNYQYFKCLDSHEPVNLNTFPVLIMLAVWSKPSILLIQYVFKVNSLSFPACWYNPEFTTMFTVYFTCTTPHFWTAGKLYMGGWLLV